MGTVRKGKRLPGKIRSRNLSSQATHVREHSPTKNKNYQTNPFWRSQLYYNHNNLCAWRTEPKRKTNPFCSRSSAPKSSFPVIPTHSKPCGGDGDTTFRVLGYTSLIRCSAFGVRCSMFPQPLCLCASVANSFPHQAIQTHSNLIKPTKLFFA